MAELSAIIRMDGSLHLLGQDRYALQLSTENAAMARKVLRLLAELFDIHGEVTVRRSKLSGANNYLVFIPWQPRLVQALAELGVMSDSLSIRHDVAPRLVQRRCCAVAFVRGLFLGGGFVGDPVGEYHLELVTGNYFLAETAQTLLRRFGLSPKVTERRQQFAVYVKDGETIAQILAQMGASSAFLKWEDVRILKAMRSSVNRLVNCDTANLNKLIEAALAQLSDIAVIETEMGLGALSKGLHEVAVARLAYPQASVKELGEACEPQLSKSAVYHRIRRLRVLASSLKR